MKESNFLKYGRNAFSQNGEDGIVEEIFTRLDIQDGYVCEFGAADGKWFSNTFNIYSQNHNFIPILIEPDQNQFSALMANVADLPKRFCINKAVDPDPLSGDSLNSILDSLNVHDLNENFSLLSIDVDGLDYGIWKGFSKYKPKVVIIEINSGMTPDRDIYKGNDATVGSTGASFGMMEKLGLEKGYQLICHAGNLIFVTKDLFPMLDIPTVTTPSYHLWLSPRGFRIYRRGVLRKGTMSKGAISESKEVGKHDNMKKIISFSLYGNKPNFQVGAVVNVLEAKRLYPDWKCRFYTTDDDVICKQLEYLGAEVVRMDDHWMNQGHYYGSLWRFLAVGDADVCIFRDTDSVVNERELGAVNEWLSTEKQWHIMHDHDHHKNCEIMAGMFGYRACEQDAHDGRHIFDFKNEDSMLNLIKGWLNGSTNTSKGFDQKFLSAVIHPKVKNNSVSHGLNGQQFPDHVPCRYGNFVGDYSFWEGRWKGRVH